MSLTMFYLNITICHKYHWICPKYKLNYPKYPDVFLREPFVILEWVLETLTFAKIQMLTKFNLTGSSKEGLIQLFLFKRNLFCGEAQFFKGKDKMTPIIQSMKKG